MLTKVGSATDVAVGQMRAFKVDGARVAVANVEGHLYGIDDSCTHNGCSLASGDLDGTTVQCRCHGSQFDVRSGEVLEGPAEEPVATWMVEVQGADLLIGPG